MNPMTIMAIVSAVSAGYGIGKDLLGGSNDIATKGTVNNSAWQTQAKAVQDLINRNLTQNTIPTINREWAPRYFSGQRQEAIGKATESAQFAGANAIAQLALQQWLGQTGMEEERAWRQAQLDSQPGWGEQLGSGLGQILPLWLYSKYGQKSLNPFAPASISSGTPYTSPSEFGA